MHGCAAGVANRRQIAAQHPRQVDDGIKVDLRGERLECTVAPFDNAGRTDGNRLRRKDAQRTSWRERTRFDPRMECSAKRRRASE